MGQLVKRIVQALFIFIFFVAMTSVFYLGMNWLDRLPGHGNYDQVPDHGAVSVSSDRSSSGLSESDGPDQFPDWRRILVFIRDGE
ncbi:DUF4227 family protein [Sporolactobacillus vineae]|uniref:DUF4227 family protein n=1 Tax=Sporolactobacillus vineae TaxID=444463 RepID=UPI000289C732|nr:DUF4227 family protein [Sporolactobacillus vineae]